MTPACAVLNECSGIVRGTVETARADLGSLKAAIPRAATRLGLTIRRVEAYWWGEAKLIAAHEADSLRRAAIRIHAEDAVQLAQRLDAHQAARTALRASIRPSLTLQAPPGPVQQFRLAL